ncbi:MAG: hypothetical protein FJ395_09315 [Verrucomicrobia bacterium]|nr:hypothetical protein [Verrucomicrobiota bacterium]
MVLSIREIAASPPVNSAWALPPLRHDIKPACLTDLLQQIPEFQRALFPNSRRAVTQINRALKAGRFIPASDDTRRGSLYSSVALAVDRGALSLAGHDITTRAIQHLESCGGKSAKLASALKVYSPVTQDILESRDAVGWLYILGRLEPVIRGFRPISDIDLHALPNRLTKSAVRTWLAGAVPIAIGNEIVQLLRNVQSLQLSGRFFPNPVFGGIGAAMGSDGDWIAGDTLVELKCTLSGVKREHIVQIICYAALSQQPYVAAKIPPFTNLAICLPRQSAIIVGTIEDWMTTCGAPSSGVVFDAILHYFGQWDEDEFHSRRHTV